LKYFNLIFSLSLLISINCFSQKIYKRNYDENNKITSEGWLENNKKIKFWTFYYKNGNIKKEGHFSENKETKYWKFYNISGRLEKEGHYKNGKKDDWWLFYDANEKINHKCQLENNQKNGYCLMYRNEKLIAASKYQAGKKLKEWTTFAGFKKENKLSDLK
jgi:antitoxin component YwqK of YwqJK toxin-antitoxin module